MSFFRFLRNDKLTAKELVECLSKQYLFPPVLSFRRNLKNTHFAMGFLINDKALFTLFAVTKFAWDSYGMTILRKGIRGMFVKAMFVKAIFVTARFVIP